jgi:hypothetical protein
MCNSAVLSNAAPFRRHNPSSRGILIAGTSNPLGPARDQSLFVSFKTRSQTLERITARSGKLTFLIAGTSNLSGQVPIATLLDPSVRTKLLLHSRVFVIRDIERRSTWIMVLCGAIISTSSLFLINALDGGSDLFRFVTNGVDGNVD